MSLPATVDLAAVREMLKSWIFPLLDERGREWVAQKVTAIEQEGTGWVFFSSFSAVPRFTGKTELKLDADALAEAETIRSGWNPALWSVDQATRTLIALSLPSRDVNAHKEAMERLFNAADIGESIALYQALPLFPVPEHYIERAKEGLRSNMTSVFEAVAHNNPFPSDFFKENAWNQMVLKCCFVGSSLHHIVGIDDRANPTLARMLVDYAHERWAASRVVTPDLWRPVGPFITDAFAPDLERVLNNPVPEQHEAAALALAASSNPKATALLETRTDLKARIESGTLTWN